MIALLRAKPVFVDILSDTFNMDPDKLESAITSRTKAIMPVGIYGQCADMTQINAIAQKHGLPVIEDAAQCFGATHHGKKACNLSLIGCTSFFPSKRGNLISQVEEAASPVEASCLTKNF